MASSRNARIKSQVSSGQNDVTWFEYRYRPGTAMLAPVPNVLRISLNFRSSRCFFFHQIAPHTRFSFTRIAAPSITSAYCLQCLPAIYRLGSSLFICHTRRAARLHCRNECVSHQRNKDARIVFRGTTSRNNHCGLRQSPCRQCRNGQANCSSASSLELLG